MYRGLQLCEADVKADSVNGVPLKVPLRVPHKVPDSGFFYGFQVNIWGSFSPAKPMSS